MIDLEEKQKVLEVLGYWELIEFLEQKDIERQSKSIKELISNHILKNIPFPSYLRSIDVYHYIGRKITDEINIEDFLSRKNKDTAELFTEDIKNIKQLNIKQLLSEDAANFGDFKYKDAELTFNIGNIPRNDLVEYLIDYLPEDEKIEAREFPELPYQQEEAIAWFGFQTDIEGRYKKKSFGLSPILWTLSEWNSRKNGLKSYSVDINQYKEDCEALESFINQFEDPHGSAKVEMFLPQIYEYVFNKYVIGLFPKILQGHDHRAGFFKYSRQKSERKSNDSFSEKIGGSGFYLDEITNLKSQINDGWFGDKTPYQRLVIDFILSADYKRTGKVVADRISISPKNNANDSFRFFADILNIKNAPCAKWPSKFKPALMQQVAVNIAIKEGEDNTPIFSVNGPPGTGKTTLLKEILANNIVKRAKAIADLAKDDPDSIFEKCFFKNGTIEEGNTKYYAKNAKNYFKIKKEFDVINNYGMLVTSCNNAAVENITIDLPKLDDLLNDIIKPADMEKKDADPALVEMRNLFDPDKSDDIEVISVPDKNDRNKTVNVKVRDVLFTRYSDKLVNPDSGKNKDGAPAIRTWGLISAPLGRSANVKNYCYSVLTPFLNDYGSPSVRAAHLTKYRELRKKFLEQYGKVEALEKELEKLCKSCVSAPNTFKLPEGYNGGDIPQLVDRDFVFKYVSPAEDKVIVDENGKKKQIASDSTNAQLSNPWITEQFNREREKLFFYACKLHKEFVISSDCMRQNIENALVVWKIKGFMKGSDAFNAFPIILQSLFLLTPVFSTTFASIGSFLKQANKAGIIGMLIVDEAGQASPHVAAGALYRCRKAVIVGDPKQIEPVVTAETDMFKKIMTSNLLSGYKDKRISVQGFADYINPYGTFLGEGDEREWVGCPLVVHRRCTDPMYSISNILSYDGTMKNQSRLPDSDKKYILPNSCWINTEGSEDKSNNGHYVKNQGMIVLRLLEAAFNKTQGIPKLYIISPFTSVTVKITDEIKNSELYKKQRQRVQDWLNAKNIGTVHTFQGKGTDEVIFLLGCDKTSLGAANWVNKNIVNVAATRAKKRFYIIGDKEVWKGCQSVNTAREIIKTEYSNSNLDEFLIGAAPKPTEPASKPAEPAPKAAPTANTAPKPAEPAPKAAPTASPAPMPAEPAPKAAPTASPAPKPAESAPKAAPPRRPDNVQRICPKCGKSLIKKGADFWGCTGYDRNDPNSCRYTTAVEDPMVACPRCGKEITDDYTDKNGNKYWKCSCRFIPKCPECGGFLFLVTDNNGKRVWRCKGKGHTVEMLKISDK